MLMDDGQPWVRLTAQEAQLNLRAVLELCASGAMRCSEKTGRASAATIRAVSARLVDGDFYSGEPIAAFAWPLLLQAGGLARIDGGRLQLTTKGRAALRMPTAELIRSLWQRWLTHATIDEFSRIDEVKGQRIKNVLSAAKPRRQAVATALAGCPIGEWIGVDALFTTMRQDGVSLTIARNDRALWKLYLVDPQYGSLGYLGYHGWEILEGRYTLAVLFEYAGTLGLIDLEYVRPEGERDDFQENWGADELDALSRYDGLRAIRLNPLGSFVLGLAETYELPAAADPASALKVLPNLDVVVTGSLAPGDELLLSAYAEQTADRVWAISAASLLTALDAGRELAELTGFLVSKAENELPGTLHTLINDVTRRAGQLTDLGHVRVIECADAALATLLTRDRATRSLCRLIGDRHLAIPLDAELKFRTALRKLGYVMPAYEGRDRRG